MVLSIFPSRFVRLRRHPGSGLAGWAMERPAAKALVAGKPQRIFLYSRPHQRKISAGFSIWEGDLGNGHRAGWKAATQCKPRPQPGREPGVSWRAWAHQLVFAVLQPRYRALIRGYFKGVGHFHQRAAQLSLGT